MKLKFTFFFLLVILTNQLIHAQGGCTQVYYLDQDNDGYGTSAVFSGETAQNYGSGQYLGSWGQTINFPTVLNNLVSFNYSITNTAAMSQCIFRFYSGANQVASVETYPQNGETISTVHNFTAPLFNVTSVVVYSYWNPAYLNSLTFLAIPSSVTACAQPLGYASNNTDCNDANAALNPGMVDICNAIDDNCDGQVDNGFYYADLDGDGYGVSSTVTTEGNSTVILGPTGIVINGSNDLNTATNYLNVIGQISFVVPTSTTYTFNWSYVTSDGEGPEYDRAYFINNQMFQLSSNAGNNTQSGSVSVAVTAGSTFGFAVISNDGIYGPASLTITNFNGISNINGGVLACVAPVGYVSNHNDCNDNLSAVHPGATEVCNTFDDDCDTQVDEGVTSVYYLDTDGDGYGINPGVTTQGSSSVTVTPGVIVINGSNAIDFNQGGVDLKGQISFVVPTTTTYTFNWNYVTYDPDGPELDPAYYVNNTLVQLTNNVGSNTQSGSVSIPVTAGSTFGFAVVSSDGLAGQATLTITNFNGFSNIPVGEIGCVAPTGYVANQGDCNDNLNTIHSGATELCNTIDEDCDGVVDDGLNTFYADSDGDGYGAGAVTITCTGPAGYVLNNTDCNNNSSAIHPSAVEVCNGVDENCNGLVDEGFAPDITNVTSCGPYVWAENNTTYNSSGTYYINPPASTTYSSYASFVSASNSAGYQVSAIEDFNEFWEYSAGASGSLGDGFPTWSAGANTGFYCIPVNGSVALAPNDFGSPITLYFSSGVTGVGGNFCITNVLGTLMNHTINFSLSDGTTQSMVINSYDTFTGFLSSGALITSITINTPWISANNPYVRIDNLIVTTGTPPTLPCSAKALQLVVNNLGTYYADADGDGFGTGTETVTCNPPLGSVSNNWDCNDAISTSFPGAIEVCNGVDDNCDGQTDEGLNTFYTDLDGDGFGGGSAIITCNPASGYVVINNDCNDNSAAINPDATEICNAVDDNCDGQVDEGLVNSYYADADGDGFGADAVSENFAPGSWILYNPNDFVLVGTSDYFIGVSNTVQFVAPTTETYSFDWAYAILDDPDQDPAYYYVNDQIVVLSNEWGALYQSGSVSITVNAGDVFGFGINSWDDEAGPVWLAITNFNHYSYMGISRSCIQPLGYVTSNNDCNNSNAGVNIGATEICNGVDDNCDGVIDEGVQNTYYVDADLDGFGGNTTAMACAISTGYSANNSDCNENVASINPGSSEICNGIDENCNGQIDEGVQSTFYLDEDNDGYGTSAVFSGATAQNYGSGQYLGSWGLTVNFPTALNNLVSFNYSITNTAAMSQCIFRFYNGANQVASVEVYPQNGETISTGYNFSESLFGITSVQVFSYWNPAYLNSLTFSTIPSSVISCSQPTGYASTNTDCDDANASVNPGMQEICNAVDDDCDSQSDNTIYYADADNDGYGDGSTPGATVCFALSEYVDNNDDCNDALAAIQPGAIEVCNSIDDNCDTQIDEGLSFTNYYADVDGDGYGVASPTNACSQPFGTVLNNTDCDDSDQTIYPDAVEYCNGIDEDCDTQIDEGVQDTYYTDADGDGFGAGNEIFACTQPAGTVSNNTDCDDASAVVNPTAIEICNGIDDNCADGIDNGLQFNNYYSDADGDNYGAGAAQSLCANPGSGFTAQAGDCNNSNSAIKPGASEICGNGIDEDCSGADLICPSNGGISSSVNIINIGTYNTGVQTNVAVNLNNGIDTPENPGAGNELWYHFTAQSNAIRIQLTGSNNVSDDNDLSIFEQPTTSGIALIPLMTEDDVHPGSQGMASDGGNEILLFDGLMVGNTYYVCLRNNNNNPAVVSMRISYLRNSQTDIALYTNYTGIYANTCQNFKVKYRAGASGYTVKRFNSESNALSSLAADWTYSIPAGLSATTASTVCQLGKIVPPNLGNVNQTYFITVDAHYNLLDAFGNLTPITANGNVIGSLTLAPEADLTVRSSDQCPNYKFLTSSIATNRSVCGVTQYNWEFTKVLPSPSIAVTVNGSLGGGSRILPVSLIPGVGLGNTFDVRVRAKHADNSYTSFTLNPACVRTIGSSGMPTLSNDNEPSSIDWNKTSIDLFPSLCQGEMVQLNVVNFEGNLSVDILDASGRLIQKENFVSEGSMSKLIVFHSILSNGMYHAKVSNGNETRTLKFVVSK